MSNLYQYQTAVTTKVNALMQDPRFARLCAKAGVPVSRRQARKFLQKRGKTYQVNRDEPEQL